MLKVQAINRHRMLVDGEGVTTLVGLWGCPLKCEYCINKDVLSKEKYKQFSPEELWKVLEIDYCYFLSTGGGIVFGGGEPLLHENEILEFIEYIPEGVSVLLETSLNYPSANLPGLLDKCKQLIIDIKALDPQIYEKYTGRSPKHLETNLHTILQLGYEDKCLLRIPVIPGYKTIEECKEEKSILEQMGFRHFDIFPYVLRK